MRSVSNRYCVTFIVAMGASGLVMLGALWLTVEVIRRLANP
jgi:hypothetical protein